MELNQANLATLEQALEALKKTTGLTGRIIDRDLVNDRGIHVDIELADQTFPYQVEIKRVDRFITLGQIRHLYTGITNQRLLVAPRITTEIADKCRELDLQFIDTRGNAYLRQRGLYVLVKGQRDEEAYATGAGVKGPRAGTPTALRVIFALLCKPELLNAPYRDINPIAGVALGAVGWVFTDLKTRGFTTGGMGKENRVLLERQKLIQEWVTNFPIKLRPKLNPRRFHATIPDWWKNVDVTEYGAQWGGEIAADKLTGYLKPNQCTIYLHKNNARQNLNKLVVDHRLRADPKGEIEILDAFWDFGNETPMPETVPALLVYADLHATFDPRNLETAQIIYDRYITENKT